MAFFICWAVLSALRTARRSGVQAAFDTPLQPSLIALRWSSVLGTPISALAMFALWPERSVSPFCGRLIFALLAREQTQAVWALKWPDEHAL